MTEYPQLEKPNQILIKKALFNPRGSSLITTNNASFRRQAYVDLNYEYEEHKESIGRKIYLARNTLGFSCETLDSLSWYKPNLSLTHTAIRKIEKGKSNIQLESLYKICFLLKISPCLMFITTNDLMKHKRSLSDPLKIHFGADDRPTILKEFRTVNEKKLKKAIKDCDKYLERIISDALYKRYSWTAMIGAILGLYVSECEDWDYFVVGADLSVKLFKEMYD